MGERPCFFPILSRVRLTLSAPQTLKTFADTVRASLGKLQPKERSLLFVQRLDHGMRLSELLGCDFYRGSTDKSLNDTERANMMHRWRAGTHAIMVATDAFGPGNDYPWVKKVWIFGSPKGIVDMLQMAGRGGRNGTDAEVQVVSVPGIFPSANQETAMHLGGFELKAILSKRNTKCWRESFTSFLDGDGRKCLNSNVNILCPSCSLNRTPYPSSWHHQYLDGQSFRVPPKLPSPRLIPPPEQPSPRAGQRRPRAMSGTVSTALQAPGSTAPPADHNPFLEGTVTAQARRSARQSKVAPLIDRAQSAIQLLSGHCAFCRFYRPSLPLVPHHTILECTSFRVFIRPLTLPRCTLAPYTTWVKALRYPEGSGLCYFCHIPYFNDRLHKASAQGQKGCVPAHKDMVAPVVYWAYFTPAVRDQMQHKFGQVWATDKELAQWLTRKDHGPDSFTNMMLAFLWLVEDVLPPVV